MTMKAIPIKIDWHPRLSVYASEEFLKAVSDEYGWIGGIDEQGALRCVLPYTIVKKATVRMARFRVETIAPGDDVDLLQEKAFLNNVVAYLRSIGADLIIPASTNTLFRTAPDGAIVAPYGSYIIDLSISEEALWKKVHSKHRNVIRNARSKGVEILSGPEYAGTAYELVRDTFKRSDLTFMSYDSFKRMITGLGGRVKVFVATLSGTIQGCAVVPYSQHSAYYAYGGSISPSPVTGATNLIQWHAICHFRDLGVKQYDFCGARLQPEEGSKQAGLVMYKERFGGPLRLGYMWKYNLSKLKSPIYSLAVKLIRGGDIVDKEHHKLSGFETASREGQGRQSKELVQAKRNRCSSARQARAQSMNQVIQNFRTGDLYVDELPMPSISPGFVLVRNEYSLISAGTERSTVSAGRASLLGKAQQRPDLVKQVLETFRREGLAETLKRVRTKLDTLKELGYSSAGTVLMSMDSRGVFKPGDRVACGGGGYALHAGIVSVPQNLVVRVPDSVGLDCAAFTTIGSIAIQSVRQANPKLGELVCVIGLGLLGQLTAQILRANGCQVFGIDTSAPMVELGSRTSCHRAATRDDPALQSTVDLFTEGNGFDSVIITAAAQTNDPVELATMILRQKGSVVVVGAVPMNIPREPNFYKKELELKISCSYGPGRYDHSYEEEGHDYPYGYVRWTENRNMAAFVKLLENKSVDVKPLITHVFEVEKASEAYDIVTGKARERHIAMLLKYGGPEEETTRATSRPTAMPQGAMGIGFIGAGSFAQKFLIPYAKACGELVGVATSRGITAKSVATKFGFRSFSTDPCDLLSNPSINAVFIATRHDSHAGLAVSTLRAGKDVFVEKPLALCNEDLRLIAETYRRQRTCRLMVGFNRRFAPLACKARELFAPFSAPLVINYRINAGFIPRDHWIQTDQGGGRILGEVCHFVDLLQFLTSAEPTRVFAESISGANNKTSNQDNLAITIGFSNGSIGLITYLACGEKLLAKERIEVFGSGKSLVIDDFKTAEWYDDGSRRKFAMPGKGHREEVQLFLASIAKGEPSPIPFESICYSTVTTFSIIDSLQTGLPQHVTIP
jgi:predicted dehydrogenase/threonine dehydrogenase-like Zn-dependent dehydrogenase